MKNLKVCLVILLVAAAVFIGMNEVKRAKQKSESSQKSETSSKKVPPSGGDPELKTERATRLGDRSPRKKSPIITTDSGLQYEVLEEGEGENPGPASTVEVHYEGRLEDGTLFDSSYVRRESATFPLDAVIKGWTEGLQLMKPGAKYRFTIPSGLAYGDKGAGQSIPEGATLVFEVELISIKKH